MNKRSEVASASGLSQAPTSHSKQLAKRPRPSLREDSSPNNSPPRQQTPPTPDDNKALEMRAPVVPGNREAFNYKKVDSGEIVK
jgi:hypothetical protein